MPCVPTAYGRLCALIVLVSGCWIGAGAAFAQSHERPLPEALDDPVVQRALQRVDDHTTETADRLAQIGGITAPSGQERERALAVRALMERIGLTAARVDSVNNAIGVLPGRSDRVLVFISTLDDLATVAEHQRTADRPPYVDGDRVVGPGTNTSSTTAAMLAAAEALVATNLQPRHTLVFAAVAQEETGLVGMKTVYEQYRDRAVAFVDILGDGSRISYGALGIHWWRVEATGPPGHTLRGGLPNVNQGIGRAVDRILQLPHPERHANQRTALNVGIIESGSVFNHKPSESWFSLDVRSLDAAVIDDMEQAVDSILRDVQDETTIQFERVPETLIPGGQIPGLQDADLVQTASAIARHLGLDPAPYPAGSSNMNIAIAGGTPAIGLGGDRGGQRGQPGEWASIPAMMRTAKHVLLLAVTMGGAAS